jgi:UDP-N-acetylglucosamine 2-epimerase (non-hydrolysing)
MFSKESDRVHKVSVVLGIRPDFIRTSRVLKLLHEHPRVELTLIHTGQHYDKNLNEVFFEQLEIPRITHQLDTRGKNHNEQHSKLIMQLSDTLEEIRPDVCLFLGDANAVVGCIAPLKLGIPIAHIEAGMRSYDWVMPEERNRVIIDRVSDVLYVYQDDYRVQLIQEGVDPSKIVVTGNVIVDVMNEHMDKTQWKAWEPFEVEGMSLGLWDYALMTLHRNEHMTNPALAQEIINDVERAMCVLLPQMPVVMIEMPRLKALGLKYPERFNPIPPQGFFEFMKLERGAKIEFTDSGTNQEAAAILKRPCVVTRRCTERPECFDSNINVLAQPPYILDAAAHVLQSEYNKDFSLGDGRSSQRIVDDLVRRLDNEWGNLKPWEDGFKKRHFYGYHEIT